MEKHKLKLLRNSMLWRNGKMYDIEIWQCQECKKYLIIDVKKASRLNLNGLLGEEIEDGKGCYD